MKLLIRLLAVLFFGISFNSSMAQVSIDKDKKIREIILKDVTDKGIDKDSSVQIALKAARDAVLFKAWAQSVLTENPVVPSLKEKIYKEQADTLGKTEYKIYHVFVQDEKSAEFLIGEMKKSAEWMNIDPKNIFGKDVKYSFSRTDWINLVAVMPDFRKSVSEMVKGTFTASPIRVKEGWHIVGLLDSRPFIMPAAEKIDKELTALAERRILDSKIQDLLSKYSGK
jgi:peptidyl-prolyl cis-trans isomerase C